MLRCREFLATAKPLRAWLLAQVALRVLRRFKRLICLIIMKMMNAKMVKFTATVMKLP